MINGKEHIKQLLIWLHKEVISACGDGDAFWILKSYTLQDIWELVQEINENELGFFKWEVKFDEEKQEIIWGEHQEWVTITNNQNFSPPSWAQCVIIL
jgi:hypothetical protein